MRELAHQLTQLFLTPSAQMSLVEYRVTHLVLHLSCVDFAYVLLLAHLLSPFYEIVVGPSKIGQTVENKKI